ncbi:MAG: DUF3987 domain-containing protein [Planctomycetes bacterium]|nr:DUF3987 domain-containing protein [Planctomycetota bacterium]
MGESANPLLEAALAYARMGLPVFPCAPARKTPLTENGFRDAATDEATVGRWWRSNPRANIGLPTGTASGLVVLDIDPRNGGEAGFAELQSRHGQLPETVESTTGAGGRHLFIQHPGGHVPCSQGELAAGVDVKGDGGYVVLPPSVHPSGDTYAWESGSIIEMPPIVCPSWLSELVRKAATAPEAPAALPTDDGNPIPEGQRNGTLARLAGGMRRQGMSRAEILAALQVTNQTRCQPPLPDDEVERIATSVARYEPDAVSVALVEDHYEQIFAAQRGEKQAGETLVDPGPLPDELLRVPGFIGEVMDYCLSTAPYPNPVIAFCGALALQAFLAGRRVRDSGDNRTNIYLLGLAHSAAGKDWPRKVNTRIAHEVGLAGCLGDHFASGEGIQDALFVNPCMLFQTDEIDGMLQSINKAKDARYEGVMSTLLTMYSASNSIFPMRRKAGSPSPGVIDQPNLIIFGTAIPNHYYEALSERMLTNGFFARMVILESGPRCKGQEPRMVDLPERVLETAHWWSGFRPGRGNLQDWHPVPVVVEATEEAQTRLIETREEAEAEYAKAEDGADPVGTTVWGRVSEQVRKLALLYTISADHESPRIGLEAVRWASQFVLHQTRRMLFMASSHVADNPFHAECLKLMQKLRDTPGHEIAHSALLKRMKIDAKHFMELVETLAQRGDIEIVTVPRAGTHKRSYRLLT